MSWLAVYSAGVSSCTCASQPLSTSTTGSKVSRTSLSIFPPSLLAPIAGGVRYCQEITGRPRGPDLGVGSEHCPGAPLRRRPPPETESHTRYLLLRAPDRFAATKAIPSRIAVGLPAAPVRPSFLVTALVGVPAS